MQCRARTPARLRHIVWPIVSATPALYQQVPLQRNNLIALNSRQIHAIMQKINRRLIHQLMAAQTSQARNIQTVKQLREQHRLPPHRKAIHLRLPIKALSTRQLRHYGKARNQAPLMAHQAHLCNTHHPFPKMAWRSVQGQMQMHQTGLIVDQ